MLLKIKKGFFDNPIIAFVLIFPFVKVNAFPYRNVQNAIIIGLFVIFLAIYMLAFKRFSHIAVWAFFFSISIIVSTLIHNRQYLFYAFFYSIRMMTFFLIFDTYLSQKKYVILSVLDNYLGILFTINLYFQVWQQDYWGYTESNNFSNFFIGDNTLPFYVMALIALTVVKSEIGHITIWDILKVVIAYLNLVKAWCASGLIAVTISLILIIVFSQKLLKFKLNLKIAAAFVVMIHLVLIFGNFLIEMLDDFFIQFFNKTIARSRLLVWRAAVQNIRRSPIFGYGTTDGGRQSINYVGSKHWYAHNFVLEYLIQGGIILLAVYMLLIIVDIRHIDQCDSKIRVLLCCVFIGLHIAFLTEGTIVEPIEYLVYILMFFVMSMKSESVNLNAARQIKQNSISNGKMEV